MDRTKDFTGREWVFQRVSDWLQSGEERVFLITGGPGTGKTALAARLFQMSLGEEALEGYPSLEKGFIAFAQFCQAFNDPTLIPLRFIEALSKHLSNRYPPYREVLLQAGTQNVTIVPSLVVGSAETVTGVKIEELRIGDLSVRDAFDRLARKPLEQLHSQDPHERIVILVDSLDEAHTIDVSNNIFRLIADVTDHSADLPRNIRFLLTSRPDPRVMSKIGKRSQDLILDLIVDAPDDVDDVRDYAYRRLKMLQEPRRSNFATRVAEAAEGNFLYVRYLLDDLIPDIEQEKVEDLSTFVLPEGLDDLYLLFIERELTRDQERWEEYFRPLLGVISVARGDGLDREQLANATGLKQSRTDDILRVCRQYLTGSYPEGPFRIYHQSFREFLLSNSEYPVYPAEAHEAIVDTYLSLEMEKWNKYGWRYLPFHLSKAGRGEELRRLLLDFEWMQSKLDATDVQNLMADYDYLPGDAELNIVQGAIRLAAHILVHDRKQLAGQLLGRLQSTSKPDILGMLENAKYWRASPWLRPLTSSLQSPEEPLIRTLVGHTGIVSAVAVTPDGKHAISASDDRTLKVWSLESGEELRTLKGHTGAVRAVAVRPDGKQAISASWDGTLRVWSLESGEELRTLKGHTGVVEDVAVTPDWKQAISASRDATLKVWNLESGEELHTLKGHTGVVEDVAVTPDGKHAISASDDRTLKVWSLESGEELHTLEGHTEAVLAVAVTPDGKHAISTSREQENAFSSKGSLKVWSLESGEELHTLKGHTEAVLAVAVTPDGKQAISASDDGTLKVWSIERGEELHTLKGHIFRVNAVAVTPDGKHAISASTDGSYLRRDVGSFLKVWSLESGEELRTPKGHTGEVNAVAVTLNGRRVISASDDHTLKVWDFETREVFVSFSGDGPIKKFASSPDGITIVVGEDSGRVHILRLEELNSH